MAICRWCQARTCAIVPVAAVADLYHGGLMRALVVVFIRYNVMMNVAKKEKSSFPESL